MDSSMFKHYEESILMWGFVCGAAAVLAIWGVFHFIIPHIHIYWK